MKCKRGYEVRKLKSAAGWYIGTLDEEGYPNCRISTCYAKDEQSAQYLVLDRQVSCVENIWCNDGKGCFSN